MIINWGIAKQPLNWAIIILMLIIAGMAGHLIMGYFGIEPATPDSSS